MAFQFDLVKEMIPQVGSIACEMFEGLKSKGLEKVHIMNEFQAITGEVVGRLFFGEKFGKLRIKEKRVTDFLSQLLGKTFSIIMTPISFLFGQDFAMKGWLKPHRELKVELKEFREFCVKVVENKIEEFEQLYKDGKECEGKSMIEIFFQQRRLNKDDALSNEEIVNEFSTFFLAGMDTTGHLLTMATYYLHFNPSYKTRLMEEIDRAFDGNNTTLERLGSMEFMTAFIKETLRLATPATGVLDRKIVKDHKLGEYDLKKGSYITLWFMANNYDPRYHEEPERFYPERWMNPDSLTMKSVTANPYVFTPFSSGPRICIGQHLAMNEARVIFSLFLKSYDFEFSNKDYKLKMRQLLMYEPVDPILLNLKSKTAK